ncbi:extracellular solute-binding protein [Ancylobacter sp. MQZ15Z-1]|uniref:Extracellular solute-binding protein n=1 Tax=Ancylobacter mangrovi TaxID=2972472 RepID=A0A9X2PEE0_9HYPH|nr:extracellular solute-binding protein [Ancylobacter mangrovi]MCS0494628.1 extracellular solute-binding protein [Ancylobacter mangrovi]
MKAAGAAGGLFLMGKAPALAQGTQELTFLTGEDGKDTQAVWAKMFKEFTDKNKSVSAVVPEYLNPDEALSRLSILLNTGQAPDVGKFDDVELTALAYNGMLEPVTDIVEAIGVPEGARLRYKGEDYFVPSDIGIPMMFYRKDWFDKAGLQAPKGWDDYLKAAETLTDKSQRRYGDLLVTNPSSGYTTNVALNQAWSNGGLFFDWIDGKWQVVVDQHKDELTQTIEWFKKRTAFSPVSANYAYAQVNQAFAAGNVAMIEYPGARTLNYLHSDFPDIEKVTGVAPVPANKKPAVKLSNGGLCIFKKQGRDPAAAKALVRSMVESPLYLEWLWTVPGHLVPTNKALFLGKWREHEFFKAHPDLLATIDAAYPSGYSAVTGPVATKGPDLNPAASSVFRAGVYASLIGSPILDGTSAEQTLGAIAKSMQTAMDKLKT